MVYTYAKPLSELFLKKFCKGERERCMRCGKKFEVGDQLISRLRRRRNFEEKKFVLYHQDCYDKMWLDL